MLLMTTTLKRWGNQFGATDVLYTSGGAVSLTSASISACLFSSSLATTMALCLPERLQHTAHSQSNVTTASSSGDIWTETCVTRQYRETATDQHSPAASTQVVSVQSTSQFQEIKNYWLTFYAGIGFLFFLTC